MNIYQYLLQEISETNKYSKKYLKLIEIYLDRKIIPKHYVKHHIVPESFFEKRKRKGPKGNLKGDPDDKLNFVYITEKEHFILHLLLSKMFSIHSYDAKMKRAFKKMICCSKHLKINARNYEKIKLEEKNCQKGISINRISVVDTLGNCLSISKSDYYNQIGDKDLWKYVSTASKEGKRRRNLPTEDTEETRLKKSQANFGKKQSEETKTKLSKINSGKIMKQETKSKISKANIEKPSWIKGKRQSLKTKEKISESNKGFMTCVNKLGISKKISKKDYNSQEVQDKSLQEWVLSNSNEGKQRLNNKKERGITCINKLGSHKNIPKIQYYSQKGDKENWEWVSVKSKYAKTRKLNFFVSLPT